MISNTASFVRKLYEIDNTLKDTSTTMAQDEGTVE
jgi:hypothetical protein